MNDEDEFKAEKNSKSCIILFNLCQLKLVASSNFEAEGNFSKRPLKSIFDIKMDYSDGSKVTILTQPNPEIMGRCGCCASPTDVFVHHWLPDRSAPVLRSDSHTDHPSSRQKLDSAPATETLTKRSSVGRAFHRDLHQEEFLWCWATCVVLQGRKGMGGNI